MNRIIRTGAAFLALAVLPGIAFAELRRVQIVVTGLD